MISSMTGFGRGEALRGRYHVTVEMKSVNNRYLDLNIKLPRKILAMESEVRSRLKGYMKRGKVDVYITLTDEGEGSGRVRCNTGVARDYCEAASLMARELEIDNDIAVSHLLALPEVFSIDDGEIDESDVVFALMSAVDQAGEQFAKAREREGEFLMKDLLDKLGEMMADIAFIEEASPDIVEAYKKSLREKIGELIDDAQVEENRILMEVTLYADKICVDEELVRLKSHVEAMSALVQKGDEKEGVGRRLDFLAQEMNREANTILSKANDISVSDRGINLKTAIEKVREQIQNIE